MKNINNKTFLMYNPDKKTEFINYKKENKETFQSIFTKTKKHEESIACDLNEFNKSDFIELFLENEWLVYGTFHTRKSNIKEYLQWCNCEKSVNEIKELEFTDLTKKSMLDNSFFKDFQELHRYVLLYIESLTKDKEQYYERIIAVIYLIWLGLDTNDIDSLMINNFDYDNKVITCKNAKRIEVDNPEILGLLNKVKQEAINDNNDKFINPYLKIDKYSSNFISGLLARFNNIRSEKTFKQNKISLCGLYSKIRALENKYNLDYYADYERINLMLGIIEKKNSNVKRNERLDYGEWKNWCGEFNESTLLKDEINSIMIEAQNIGGSQKNYWSYIESRIGQSYYRECLIKRNNCKCLLCSIKNKEVLIASHIKEFAECNEDERYDIMNGLLLCANHDKLFDRHKISFDISGNIMISETIVKENYDELNIRDNLKIDTLLFNNKYMEYHRKKLESI